MYRYWSIAICLQVVWVNFLFTSWKPCETAKPPTSWSFDTYRVQSLIPMFFLLAGQHFHLYNYIIIYIYRTHNIHTSIIHMRMFFQKTSVIIGYFLIPQVFDDLSKVWPLPLSQQGLLAPSPNSPIRSANRDLSRSQVGYHKEMEQT